MNYRSSLHLIHLQLGFFFKFVDLKLKCNCILYIYWILKQTSLSLNNLPSKLHKSLTVIVKDNKFSMIRSEFHSKRTIVYNCLLTSSMVHLGIYDTSFIQIPPLRFKMLHKINLKRTFKFLTCLKKTSDRSTVTEFAHQENTQNTQRIHRRTI